MLDTKRIKRAEANVRRYLSDGLLNRPSSCNHAVLKVMRQNAYESLRVAELCLSSDVSSLWAIVCSYYSMFYMANAVLYHAGIKVGDKIVHKVTSDSLIVFVRGKMKALLIEDYNDALEEAAELAGLRVDFLMEQFEKEYQKRALFQYGYSADIKKSKAETSVSRARGFIVELEKLLPKYVP